MSKKIGFWGVIALVVGSQVGSGVFTSPITLAPYGLWSFGGLLISGVGAVALAFVFAVLCHWFPKTGGPHVYAEEAFGKTVAFFTGWTYWVVSWVGTTVVIMACVGYVASFFSDDNAMVWLPILQVGTITLITVLNWYGVKSASQVEIVLNVLRVLPLLIIPILALKNFSLGHITVDHALRHSSPSSLLGATALMTIWGFIGLEAATAPAGSVENPKKIIPLAIFVGTIGVVGLYLLNSAGILGLLPTSVYVNSLAPYADATKFLLGPVWANIVAVLAAIVCLGSVNAWVLTGGQIILGLSKDGLVPAWFGKQNKYGAPGIALLLAYMGCSLLLLLTQNDSFAKRLSEMVDISVMSVLFVYLISCLALFKILIQKWTRGQETTYSKPLIILAGLVSLAFCFWIFMETPLSVTAISLVFTFSGVPVYFWMKSGK